MYTPIFGLCWNSYLDLCTCLSLIMLFYLTVFFLCMMYVLCHFEDYEGVLLATLTELTVLHNERESVGLSKDKTPVKFPYMVLRAGW